METAFVTASPDAALGDVAALMVRHRVDGVAVVEGERLVGMITAAEFLQLLLPNRVRFLDVDLYLGPRRLHQELLREIAGVRAKDVMTPAVHTVAPDTPLEQVISLLGQHGRRHLPVVEEGRLVGMIDRIDVVRLFTHGSSREETRG